MSDNQLATIEQSNEITAQSFQDGAFTTCDTTTEQGRKAFLRALNNSESLAEIGDQVLKVVDVVIEPGVRKARQAGQQDTPCVNITLVTLDGKAYMTQSDGIARSVRNILLIYPKFGRSAEAGYLEIQVINRVLNNGNTLKSLDVL